MWSGPLVSVGLPVWNGEPFVAEAIDAILEQSHENLELIIGDNASTDRTESICRARAARDSRVRYHRHASNIGAARNFNFTFRQSRGRYFKWAAHDDVILPEYVERCLEHLEQGDPAPVLAYGQRRVMRPGGQVCRRAPSISRELGRTEEQVDLSFEDLLRLPADHFPTLVFGLARSDALAQTRLMGAYPSADLVLVAELRLQGRFSEVPEPMYFQRRHAPTRIWRERSTKRGEGIWYDPRNKARSAMSTRKLFVEHLRAIQHAPIEPGEKLQAYAAMRQYVSVRFRRLVRSGRLMRRIKEEVAPQADPKLY